MADIIITYETLYDTLRREKNRAELQKLDDSFYQNAIEYIKNKKEILNSQEKKQSIFTTIEVQKTRKQLENIQKMLKELYERRESKIIQLALMSSRTNVLSNDKSLMLKEEKQFYDEIKEHLNHFRENVLQKIVIGKEPDVQRGQPKDLKTDIAPTKKTKLVRLTHEIPKFVGLDLNTYGPFEREDIASLPMEIAELLINKKKAEEIKS